jgi:hypothetical protein
LLAAVFVFLMLLQRGFNITCVYYISWLQAVAGGLLDPTLALPLVTDLAVPALRSTAAAVVFVVPHVNALTVAHSLMRI